MNDSREGGKRAGIVAVVGAANAGKSSLINRLMGEKISIVSPVPQTTRNLIRGIYTEPRGQLVFLDTPGVHQALLPLNQQMNKAARTAPEGSDVVMLVVDRSVRPALEVEGWIRRLVKRIEAPRLIVLNKTDCGGNHDAEIRALYSGFEALSGNAPSTEWFHTSAETGAGVDALRNRLFEMMPEGPALFPEDIVSDFPRKLAIADVIREKFLLRLHQELPHSIAVWVEHLVEDGKRWTIEAHVYVRRDSQKGMVIGNKGRLLKSVRAEATPEIAEMYGVEVQLDLVVKVMRDWDKNFWILRKLGYA